jgi:hypothetical protein
LSTEENAALASEPDDAENWKSNPWDEQRKSTWSWWDHCRNVANVLGLFGGWLRCCNPQPLAEKEADETDASGHHKVDTKGRKPTVSEELEPNFTFTCANKVIAKLLANRLNKILPELADIQQNGFMQGRSIHENIFTLKLV